MRAALVLAAGGSRRFGKGDKLRARLRGRTLLAYAVMRAREAGVCRVMVVVARHPGPVPEPTVPQEPHPRLKPTGGPRNTSRVTRVVLAPEAHLGMGASLAAGLAALRPIEREVLIFLADMPFAAARRGMRLRAGVDAVRPRYRDEPGHPLLVRTAVARRIARRDDRGLIAGLARARVAHVTGGAGNILDIDTIAALARVRRRIAGVGACDRERR